jgi:peptidyl-prolyl cis-trans isomerase D
VIRLEQERLRVAVPDGAVRDYVRAIPAFRGGDGNFSRPMMESFLRNSELGEQQFIGLVRADLARQQLANSVRAGATPPAMLTERLYRWVGEQRAAQLVALPLAQAAAPRRRPMRRCAATTRTTRTASRPRNTAKPPSPC